MKKVWIAFLLLGLLLCSFASAEGALPSVGDTVEGFTVTDVSRFEMIGADLVQFTHNQTGAKLLYIANDDTNRVFDITFRTPALNDSGLPHVFEHSTLDGSEKYPPASLFFNLCYQTYNTYMNAGTYNFMTSYPVASLSEAQLLAYADYYTDSCLHPMLMKDETIFQEEAWRYSLTAADAELTLAGTVYSEMMGAMTLSHMANYNLLKAIVPGSTKANVSGGLPSEIPSLTYEALCDYHDAYYHPSNSLTCLYGSFEDYAAFLRLLDGYFSQYEKRLIVVDDPAYTPISEPVEAVLPYPLEVGADERNGSVIQYGIVCDTADMADLYKLDLLTTMLMDGSSAMAQAMKERFPSGSFGCSVDITTPEPLVFFRLENVNPEDAAPFRELVDRLLAQTALEGFSPESVDAIEASSRMSMLLISETNELGVSLIPNFALYWALFDDIHLFEKGVAELNRFAEYNQNGAFSEVINRLLTDSSRTALVTTVPAPGLKEEQDAALAAHLADVKAAMQPEEIDALVARTAALAEPVEEDTSGYLAQLQAVTVETLPEEARIYAIEDIEEHGVRYITADANLEGVGSGMLLLDAGDMKFEQLMPFSLYVHLLGELDTSRHTRAELSSLITRYLYNPTVKISLLKAEDEDGIHPYLRTTFTALDDDLAMGYDVLYELLFESDVTDVQRLKDTLASLTASLKLSLTNAADSLNIYRAFATASPTSAAFNYLNHLDFHAYLLSVSERLENDSASVVADLQAVQQNLHNAFGAIVGYAGNAAGAQKHRDVADAFLARLDNEPFEQQVYTFPIPGTREAIVIDSSVQYNLLFASCKDLDMEKPEGALDAVTALVLDAYLIPRLRDQYGVYGVMHAASEDGVYLESYRDTHIAQTFDVYDELPAYIASLEVTQEELNNYILSSYSIYALSSGELSGATNAILTVLSGKTQEEKLEKMHSLKTLTVDSFRDYARLYTALVEKGVRYTAGGAAAISAYAGNYNTILDPFGASQIKTPADLEGDDVYTAASLFCWQNRLMTALNEESFGVDTPAVLGDLASALYVVAGGTPSVEEAMEFWKEYGLMDGEATDALTRQSLAQIAFDFLSLLGAEPEPMIPEGASELSETSEATAGKIGYLLENGCLLPLEDGTLGIQSQATRGQVALFLQKLCEE